MYACTTDRCIHNTGLQHTGRQRRPREYLLRSGVPCKLPRICAQKGRLSSFVCILISQNEIEIHVTMLALCQTSGHGSSVRWWTCAIRLQNDGTSVINSISTSHSDLSDFTTELFKATREGNHCDCWTGGYTRHLHTEHRKRKQYLR